MPTPPSQNPPFPHTRTVTPSAPCRRTRLTKDGVDAWLDKEKLLPGQDWELEIHKAVCE